MDDNNPERYTQKMWGCNPGARAKFNNPSELWKAAIDYFEWVNKNPIFKEVLSQGQIMTLTKPRAMTIQGLCSHANIGSSTYYDYRKNEDFKECVQAISDVMYEQKFTNAVADEMNAGIITRDLGLADKKELSGPGGGKIEGGFTFVGVGPDDE